jgi:hypothetical protein
VAPNSRREELNQFIEDMKLEFDLSTISGARHQEARDVAL